jgi:preprotein translocase subunit SecA
MLKGILGKIVSDSSEREIRKLQPLVDEINALEPEMERRTDAELRALTDAFRTRLRHGDTVDDLLPEAFAAVREVGKRTVDMRAFDVQLVGGIVLHQGKVAEMKTGEGKTLTATMPLYLNALQGRGAHLVTVNDYLARRDALWMGPIYHLLGLSVGLLQSGSGQPSYLYDPSYRRDPYPGLRPAPRQEAYAADILYGTNHEFGFDYLRDNITMRLDRRVQRKLYYAIVDEVDNIFIDEARTPLIISGPSDEPVEEYERFARIARVLQPEVDYEVEEKERSVHLTDAGLFKVEQEAGIENIYDEANYRYVHYMEQALKAQVLFQEGRDYIRQRKRIILVDQFTGRLMPDRRLSEGLHQAIEAKEAVPIRPRDVTSATITIQNYFRMYEKLAGMSGTAVTEKEEFYKIYGLDVVAIPTNEPMIRADHDDVVYRSEEAKLRAVVREILAMHVLGRPVLVGTTSVEMSERLSQRLSGDRLLMACAALRLAYALDEVDLDRATRAEIREGLNANLQETPLSAFRALVRKVGLEQNLYHDDWLRWHADLLGMPEDSGTLQRLSRAFRNGIPHEVLNAKEHTREAAIIAGAGEPGAVTIATNMAGRGVDIRLGGELADETIHRAHQVLRSRSLDPFRATGEQMDSAIAEVTPQYARNRQRVLERGGLHILGTERHEARRIDNQLRGRAGRQGEPGSSRFYLSLEDDLLRRFGRRELIANLMERIGDDVPIEHNMISRTVERAQTSVEGYNFDIRKHLLQYDDVLNRQRDYIYRERLEIMTRADLRAEVRRLWSEQIDELLDRHGGDAEGRWQLFSAVDDLVPLTFAGSQAPFRGPLTLGVHLSTFPSFTSSFLARRLAGRSLEEVRAALYELPRHAAQAYGAYVRDRVVHEAVLTTQQRYAEQLERYQTLLGEKINDYVDLQTDRGRPVNLHQLMQHLGRVYPLKLSLDRDAEVADIDALLEELQPQLEEEYHVRVIKGLLERIPMRLPAGIRLDRVHPLLLGERAVQEAERVVEDVRAGGGPGQPVATSLSVPAADDARGFLTLLEGARAQGNGTSSQARRGQADGSRLDRLFGHALALQLDALMADYQAGADNPRVERQIERLRGAVQASKRGGRGDLLNLLSELNELTLLDLDAVGDLIGQAVAHEYDRWAQRQVAEVDQALQRAELADTTWEAIAQVLLVSQFTERQAYGRGHRRQTSWEPRLPVTFMAQVLTADEPLPDLREEILEELARITEHREQVWGRQELQRWGHLSLDDLEDETLDELALHLGTQLLGDQQMTRVDDLPPGLYDRLRFVVQARSLDALRVQDLPHAAGVLDYLGQAMEARLLRTRISELDDPALREQIEAQLQALGFFDDPAARDALLTRPVRDWDRRTRNLVSVFLGQRSIDRLDSQPIAALPPDDRQAVERYLASQGQFIDEGRVQQFLLQQRLVDLPEETRRAACLSIAQAQVTRYRPRRIDNLPLDAREAVLAYMEAVGLFTNRERKQAFLAAPLGGRPGEELDAGAWAELERRLGRAYWPAGSPPLEALPAENRTAVIARLKANPALTDQARREALPARTLAEVDPDLPGRLRESLRAQLRADLEGKEIGEMPPAVQQQLRDALEVLDYFVDEEKAQEVQRKLISRLLPEWLEGLETHLGTLRLAEIVNQPFRDLDPETQATVMDYLEARGFVRDRADRLRLEQTQTLADLDPEVQARVGGFLGRQWLRSLYDRSLAILPDEARRPIWDYLKAQGAFYDEFKAELLPLQTMDEFSPALQQAVQEELLSRLEVDLAKRPVGDLPPWIQDEALVRLEAADYFLDADRLARVVSTPPDALPPELAEASWRAMGAVQVDVLADTPVAKFPVEARAVVDAYLEEIGFFVDEELRTSWMGRKVSELPPPVLDGLAAALAERLATDLGEIPVADLAEDQRQTLRQALLDLGYFDSPALREQILAQPLGTLRREVLEGLAERLGERVLEAWGARSLAELPDDEREPVVAHLQAAGWFLDQDRRSALQGQRLADLDAEVQQEVIATLREQQAEALRQQRVGDLPSHLRQAVYRFLSDQPGPDGEGLLASDAEMRRLHDEPLHAVDRQVYEDLLRSLGQDAMDTWGDTRFGQLPDDERERLAAALGRWVMSEVEQNVLLWSISRLWIDYLTDIEDLRQGIGLRAMAQRDPLVEYKGEAFRLFNELTANIRRTSLRGLLRQSPRPLRPA